MKGRDIGGDAGRGCREIKEVIGRYRGRVLNGIYTGRGS